MRKSAPRRQREVARRATVTDRKGGKNVAILWVDPKAIASERPVKLGYADGGPPPAEKDKVFAISTPIHDAKSMMSGTVSRVTGHAILSSVPMEEDSLGAPLFNARARSSRLRHPRRTRPAGTTSRRTAPPHLKDARSTRAQSPAPADWRSADPARGASRPTVRVGVGTAASLRTRQCRREKWIEGAESPGGHTWLNWRSYPIELVPQLF